MVPVASRRRSSRGFRGWVSHQPSSAHHASVLRVARLTHIGGKRDNQDEVLVDDRFMGDPDMKLYCVFDSHGQHGGVAARFARISCRRNSPSSSRRARRRPRRASHGGRRSPRRRRTPSSRVRRASVRRHCPRLSRRGGPGDHLSPSSGRSPSRTRRCDTNRWRCALSGTTAIVALIIRDVMYVAHASDRARSSSSTPSTTIPAAPRGARRLFKRLLRRRGARGRTAIAFSNACSTTIARESPSATGRRR